MRTRRPIPLLRWLALAGLAALAAGPDAGARDILRGGSGGGQSGSSSGGASAGQTGGSVPQVGAHGQDRLARTAQALKDVQAMQAAARQLAISGANNLSADPN